MTDAAEAGTDEARQKAAPYPWLNRYPQTVDWHQGFKPAPVYALLERLGGAGRQEALYALLRQEAHLP